ncbi:MAG: helix-turn-helix domain-containing protein [Phycisphaeraceae bacterium]
MSKPSNYRSSRQHPKPKWKEPITLSLRPDEAAKALGISKRKLWGVTADKTSGIPHFRLGRSVLYPVEGLKEWMATRIQQEVK